jgi:formyltetrahydrofolate deformylase
VGYNIRLTISCPDRKGLIAAISSFIAMHDGNILSADQYVSENEAGGTFFMRLEIEGEGFRLGREEFAGAFAPLARRHEMDWCVSYTDTPKKIASTGLPLQPLPDRPALALGRRRARRGDTARRLQPP